MENNTAESQLLPIKKFRNNLEEQSKSCDSLNDSCTAPDNNRPELNAFGYNSDRLKKHLLEIIGGDQQNILTRAVTDELRFHGIELDTPSRSSRSKTRKAANNQNDNNGMNKLVEAELSNCDVKVYIPFILKETCEFIRRNIQTQGIFRKSGSSARANGIMQRFCKPDIFESELFTPCDTVFEVASVLKQYLREMVTPLIPYDVHNVLLKCFISFKENLRTETVLLAMGLLPIYNINIISYLMQFLFEVAQHSHENRMGYKNLAIVIAPNIMPVEPKRNERSKDCLQAEMKLLEVHSKVIEILIQYGDYVGFASLKLEKTLEIQHALRSSEDELENEGGKRKKRRSGSLTSKNTRMLGFLKKVTSSKGGDTPKQATPGDCKSCTPVIKGSSKRRCNEDNIFSQNRKKTVLDAVRRNGLTGDDGRSGCTASTPSSISGLIACPSPAICFDPSPMRAEWRQTPNGVRLKNLVTPSLLRRRGKTSPQSAKIVSSVTKPLKPKLGFGKKSVKKVVVTQDCTSKHRLQKSNLATSSVSIHRLANSPRASKLNRHVSTKIPCPQNQNSKCSLRKETSSSSLLMPDTEETVVNAIDSSNGEYVTICAMAVVNDEKNEAFIASSVSMDVSECDSVAAESNYAACEVLRLTPLIKQINSLTLSAQEDLTFSGLDISSQMNASPINCSNKAVLEPPYTLEKVENKFNKALKESRIIHMQNDNSSTPGLQRRFSIQEKGVSPSHRRILAVRRKSHEIGRVAPMVTQTPRYMSLRSPKSRPTPPPELHRSPTRCTLRRGRPNAMSVGLPKPSPVRSNTSKLNSSANISISLPKGRRNSTNCKTTPPPRTPVSKISPKGSAELHLPTPLRRMSSVQELVQILEKTSKSKKRVSLRCVDSENFAKPPIISSFSNRKPDRRVQVKPVALVSSTHSGWMVSESPLLSNDLTKKPAVELDESKWVPGTQFNFTKDESGKKRNGDRDSIQVLKAINAGKVSANVKLFDGMVKSPGKSLIPRYTALHLNSENCRPTINVTKSGLAMEQKCRVRSGQRRDSHRVTRRFSSFDLKNKHEQVLENVKREASVRRSATTTGVSTSNLARKQKYSNQSQSKSRPGVGTSSISPKGRCPQPKGKRNGTVSAVMKENTSEPFCAILEDEPLTASVQKAIQNILGPNLNFAENIIQITPGSPLKSSNLANMTNDIVKPSLLLPKSPMTKVARTSSERDTKSTIKTVRSTPRIKKSMTTRAYDMLNTPKNSPMGTPRRRAVLRPGRENIEFMSANTPLKAQHSVTANASSSRITSDGISNN